MAPEVACAGGPRRSAGHRIASFAGFIALLLASCARPPHTAPPVGAQAPALVHKPVATPGASLQKPVEQITVDLTVHSRHHGPAPDLQPSEVTILDGGAPVQLTGLRHVDLASGPPRLVDFLFDHLDAKSARFAHRAADRVLAAIPDTGYSLAVFQVDASLRLLQGYTRDFHLASAALAQATPSAPASASVIWTPAEDDLYQAVRKDAFNRDAVGREERKVLVDALQQSQRIVNDRRSYPSLAALQALVSSSRTLPGRKFLFFFTQGLPTASDAHERLQSIISLANRAGVTIYVVDVGSLPSSRSSEMQASQASQFLGSGGAGGNLGAFGVGASTSSAAPTGLQTVLAHNAAGFEFGDVRSDDNPVIALAAGTGGTYISGESGLGIQLPHLHDDLTSWYQATWTAPFQHFDGQFRPLEIRSTRKDLTVRARSGYFALPNDDDGILPFEVPLLQLLSQASPPDDLTVRTGVLHLGPLTDGNAVEIVAQVPVAQLESHNDGNTHLTSVDAAIVAVIKDSKGSIVERFGEHFPLHEAPTMFQHSGQTLTLERAFTGSPGTYTLEVAAKDLAGKRAGVQRTQFTLDPPATGPALSDVALVQKVEPTAEDSHDLEPMHCADGRVIPNLNPNLPSDTNALSLFFLLHPVAGSQQQPELRMQVLRDGHVLTDAPMELHPVSGTGGSIPFLASLSGAAFLPGKYTVKVLLTQDGSTTTSTADFHVDGALATTVSNAAPNSPGAVAPPPPMAPFVLTALAHPVPPPTPEEIHAMLEDAGSRALLWSDTLRNFFCLEVTDHFVNAPAEHEWRHKATLVERMRYVGHEQTRTPLLLNGEPTSVQPDRLEFAHSNGEFGAMFHILFDPAAHTEFTWKQTSFLDGQLVQVFAFQVARRNSNFYLSDRESHSRAVGFEGLLYLDPLTRNIRRVSLSASDIPHDLAIHASSMSVDYSFVSMQDHDFLLPIRGSVNLQETGRPPVLNQFEFHNYHRFGSQVRIHAKEEHDPIPSAAPPTPD